jgi:hypothetical protein
MPQTSLKPQLPLFQRHPAITLLPCIVSHPIVCHNLISEAGLSGGVSHHCSCSFMEMVQTVEHFTIVYDPVRSLIERHMSPPMDSIASNLYDYKRYFFLSEHVTIWHGLNFFPLRAYIYTEIVDRWSDQYCLAFASAHYGSRMVDNRCVRHSPGDSYPEGYHQENCS